MNLFLMIFQFFVLYHQQLNGQKPAQLTLCRSENDIILMNNTLPTIDLESTQIDAENIYCECTSSESEPWGLQILTINCQEKKFRNEAFDIDTLPTFTQSIDLSWNHFEFVPNFSGNDLLHLDISHNMITTLDDNSFASIKNLQTLNLKSNKISMLSINAFNHLNQLKKLDLSHNKLSRITSNVFSTLPKLSELILSHNRYLNETFSRSDVDLYVILGVTTQLEKLKIEYSNLDDIDIMNGVGLKELHFKGNNFVHPPDMTGKIEFLDFSQNPILIIDVKFLPHLINLHTLHLTDMPHLKAIKDYGLIGLPNLKELVLQGSWNLNELSGLAFGTFDNNESSTKIEILNLRGTPLKTLNASLADALKNVKSLDLSGNPIVCDCNTKWILNLNLETNAKCVKPSGLRGRLLSNIRLEELKCKRWADWVYKLLNGTLILVMLIVCAVLTWCIVMGVKPLRHAKLLHKVGEASPYARITIEPNQAELRR